MQGWQSEASIRNFNQPQPYTNNGFDTTGVSQSQLFTQTQHTPIATYATHHPWNTAQSTVMQANPVMQASAVTLPALQLPTLPAYSPMAYMPGVGTQYELKPSMNMVQQQQQQQEMETLKQMILQQQQQMQQLQLQLQRSQAHGTQPMYAPVQQKPVVQQQPVMQQQQQQVPQVQQSKTSAGNVDWRNRKLPASARGDSARTATFDSLPLSSDFQSWNVGGGTIQTTSGSPVEFAHTLSAARGDLTFDQRQQNVLTDKSKNYLEEHAAGTFDHNDDYTYIDMSQEVFSSNAETLQMQRGL